MYTGNILDPIHGVIKISEIEKWIIAQKPFNRLKRIKQNTFLYLVFPSSNHTRFEHSLGVMHLANQIYINSNNNYLTGNYKKEKNKSIDNKDFKFCSVSDLLKDNEKVLLQELRLAALLHDVGHGPMSHKFDQYTLKAEGLLKIIESDNELNEFKENFEKLLPTNRSKRIEHEVVSCVFIVKLISNLKKLAKDNPNRFSDNDNNTIQKISIIRIIKMIEPKFTEVKIEFENIDYTDFFNSIISSFPLDADRMDYLYRDSYFSGVKYGIYDLSRVLMSFIPVIEKDKITLCVKESGIDSIIRFIQSRTHLFNQVYFHKTNRSANMMLDFVCRKLGAGKSIINATNYIQLENFYWNNSDEIFLWNTLKKNIKGVEEKKVLDELLSRKLWKRVFQHKIVIIPRDKNNNLKALSNIRKDIKKIIAKLETKDIYVAVDNFPNVVFKDVDKTKIKIAQKNDEFYKLKDNWKNFNKELQILECEIHMFRIYLRRQFNSPEEFKKLRSTVLSEFQPVIDKLKIVK